MLWLASTAVPQVVAARDLVLVVAPVDAIDDAGVASVRAALADATALGAQGLAVAAWASAPADALVAAGLDAPLVVPVPGADPAAARPREGWVPVALLPGVRWHALWLAGGGALDADRARLAIVAETELRRPPAPLVLLGDDVAPAAGAPPGSDAAAVAARARRDPHPLAALARDLVRTLGEHEAAAAAQARAQQRIGVSSREAGPRAGSSKCHHSRQ